MKITVTQAHIDSGVMGSYNNCPIASALKDRFKFFALGKVEVRETKVTIGPARFKLPAKARRFIRGFDDGEKGKPFSFEI